MRQAIALRAVMDADAVVLHRSSGTVLGSALPASPPVGGARYTPLTLLPGYFRTKDFVGILPDTGHSIIRRRGHRAP